MTRLFLREINHIYYLSLQSLKAIEILMFPNFIFIRMKNVHISVFNCFRNENGSEMTVRDASCFVILPGKSEWSETHL